MKFKKIVFVLFATVLLVSCFKNDNDSNLVVNTDAYMIKRMSGEQAVYGVAFYAYGNQIMKSGTVTHVGGLGEQINLGLNPNSIFTLYKEPVENDFKTFPPVASEYLFNVSAEGGASNESSDYLNVKNIEIPEITETKIGDNQKLLDISWTEVTGVDGYMIKIADENGTYIYSSGGLEPTVTTYTVNILAGNWTTPLEIGNIYNIEIHAFAYEDIADESYSAFNIEEISIGEKSLSWE